LCLRSICGGPSLHISGGVIPNMTCISSMGVSNTIHSERPTFIFFKKEIRSW